MVSILPKRLIQKLNLNKVREKFWYLFFVIVVLIGLYYYVSYTQGTLKSFKWSNNRCHTELASTKYQLNVVTEFKNRIDKMLMDTRQSHDSDKVKFKEVMNSCIAIKQQSKICQNQFEDLQVECKEVREKYNQQNREYIQLMWKYKQESSNGYKEQNSPAVKTSNYFVSFSKQIEESDGVYRINILNNSPIFKEPVS